MISKVRRCYGQSWAVEAEIAGVIWDVTCESEEDADRLFHLLKMLQHKRKAGLL